MNEFWFNKWQSRSTGWHKKDVNEYLVKYFSEYCPKVKGKPRVFVPLCGKMVDMKWLLEKGCEVVGVELVKQACDEFFQEQLLEYDLLTVEGLSVYKMPKFTYCNFSEVFQTWINKNKTFDQARDHPLMLFNCDFFDFASKIDVGKFNFIWDRGSLSVIEKENQPKYAEFMKKWLADDFAYLIDAPQYKREEYQGIPPALEHSILTQLFSDTCDIVLLEKEDFSEGAKKKYTPNLTSFSWCIYIILPKKT